MDFGIVMDLEKIFDLILQVALKEDLKPEQMIKKLFVFTYCIPSRLYDSCAWETKYEAIQRMFKDIGYEDDDSVLGYFQLEFAID